ncbi:hypothetical protein ACFQHO_15480 [Actinomadura yumaensis]
MTVRGLVAAGLGVAVVAPQPEGTWCTACGTSRSPTPARPGRSGWCGRPAGPGRRWWRGSAGSCWRAGRGS